MANNFFNGSIGPAAPVGPTVGTAVNMAAQAMAPNAQAGPQSNVQFVKDMNEVLNYPTTPNEHMYFSETGSCTMWLRETDSKGQIKNPLKKLPYTIEEVAFGPEANFVTKQEHQQLYDLVSSMNTSLNKLLEEWGGSK